MPFTPKPWENAPSTDTPITAAALSDLETRVTDYAESLVSGGSGGHVIQDEGTPLTARDTLNFTGAGVTASDAGGKTVVTIPGATLSTKRVSAPIGGTGYTGVGAFPDIAFRELMALPVTPTRFRFRLANYAAATEVAGSGPLAFQGAFIGTPAPHAERWGGTFATAPTQVAAPGGVIPAAKTDLVTAWFDNIATPVIVRGKVFGFSFGATAADGVTFIYDATGGNWFYGAGAAAGAGDAAVPPGSSAAVRPLDVRLEYEFQAQPSDKVLLVIGDSIANGFQGGDDGGFPHEAWPAAAGLATGVATVNLGVPGGTFATFTADTWSTQRVDLTTTVPDICVLANGINSVIGGSTLAAMKTALAANVAYVRGLGVRDIRLATLLAAPQVASDSAKEAVRIAYNDYVAENPMGVNGCIDFAKEIATPGNPATNDTDYVAADQIHPRRRGYARMANLAAAVL